MKNNLVLYFYFYYFNAELHIYKNDHDKIVFFFLMINYGEGGKSQTKKNLQSPQKNK